MSAADHAAAHEPLAALTTAALYAEVRALEMEAAYHPSYYVRLVRQCEVNARCRELARRGEDC